MANPADGIVPLAGISNTPPRAGGRGAGARTAVVIVPPPVGFPGALPHTRAAPKGLRLWECRCGPRHRVAPTGLSARGGVRVTWGRRHGEGLPARRPGRRFRSDPGG